MSASASLRRIVSILPHRDWSSDPDTDDGWVCTYAPGAAFMRQRDADASALRRAGIDEISYSEGEPDGHDDGTLYLWVVAS